MKKISTLNEALTYHLEDMYDAEKKIQKSFRGIATTISPGN